MELFTEMDGGFTNHPTDPTVEANMRVVINVVKTQHLQVGIAHDGDADRIGAVQENGKIVWGDDLMVAFSRSILKERPGPAIIGDVKCSRRLFDGNERPPDPSPHVYNSHH